MYYELEFDLLSGEKVNHFRVFNFLITLLLSFFNGFIMGAKFFMVALFVIYLLVIANAVMSDDIFSTVIADQCLLL